MYIIQYRPKGGIWEDSVWQRNGTLKELLLLKRAAEKLSSLGEYRIVERTVTDEVVE